MKKMIVLRVLVLSLWALPVFAAGPAPRGEALQLKANELVFDYSSQDGDFKLDCVHEQTDPDLKDWKVTCGKGTPQERSFVAHIVSYRFVSRTAPARTAYQIFYSVIASGLPQSQRYTSQSMRLTFLGDAPLVGVAMDQSVENDYARLRFTIGSPY